MSEHRPIHTPLSQVLEDFRRGPLPLLVWLLAVGALGVIFTRRGQHCEFTGVARARQCQVSSSADGALRYVMVDLYQNVEAGQVVAQLDDQLIKAQMDVIQAMVERIRTQLAAEGEKLRLKDNALLGKAQADLADIRANEDKRRIDALGIKTRIETARINQQRLDLEEARLRKLLEVHAVSQQEYDNVKLRRDEVARGIDADSIQLAQAESSWQESRRQREALTGQLPQSADLDLVLQPIRESMRVQELALAELSVKRGATLLRAPITGQVVQLACQAGQSVRLGDPILTIGERSTSEAVGYMAEAAPVEVHENMPVEVARVAQPNVSVMALVSRVSPAIELVPRQLWPDSNHPRYGRPFLVTMDAALTLVPGEKILIRTSRSAAGTTTSLPLNPG